MLIAIRYFAAAFLIRYDDMLLMPPMPEIDAAAAATPPMRPRCRCVSYADAAALLLLMPRATTPPRYAATYHATTL